MPAPCLLFDLYSTLVEERHDNPFYAAVADDLDVALAAWMPAYRRCGAAAMRGELLSMADRVTAGLALAGTPRSSARVHAVTVRRMDLFLDSVRPYPDALATLDALREAGCRLDLVSNASSYSEAVLDRHGLREQFDAVVMSYAVGRMKPDPEPYRIACARLGIVPAAGLFVGDGGDNELAGARAVGLGTILIDRRLAHSGAAKRHADRVVDELHELPTMLGLVRASAEAALSGAVRPAQFRARRPRPTRAGVGA